MWELLKLTGATVVLLSIWGWDYVVRPLFRLIRWVLMDVLPLRVWPVIRDVAAGTRDAFASFASELRNR